MSGARSTRLALAALILALALVPLVLTDPYLLHMVNMAGIAVITAAGLNLLIGFTGRLNLGYAAFFGTGAYVSAILTLQAKWPFWLALPAAGMGSLAVGLLVGLPCLRLKGPYLAIATLGFNEILKIIVHNWDGLTNGPLGIRSIPAPTALWLPALGEVSFASKENFYYLLLAMVVGCLWAMHRLTRSQLGRSFQAFREDPTLAESIGIDTIWVRLVSYGLSAFFAGVAGSLYAHYVRYISPEIMSVGDSFAMVAMVVVGGMGAFAGPIVGAILFTWLPELLRAAQEYRMVIYGLTMTLAILFMRQGLVGAALGAWERIRRRPPEVAS